jgi:hypothetical protein
VLQTLRGSHTGMHRDYVGLFSGAASLFTLGSCVIGMLTTTDERGRPVHKLGLGLSERLRVRYRAHPVAVRLQFAFLIAAVVLLGTGAAMFFSA